MASVGETLEIEDAVHYGLNILGMGDLVLKDKQLEIIRYITLEKRDVMAVLPTGYGKSLVYQLIPPIVDFMEFGKTPSAAGAIVLVFSPLNALIRDQVIKLRESGLKACILKGDRVALDVEDAEEEEVHVSLSTAGPLESLKDFQLIFCHPEAVVENKKVLKMFKTTEFQRRIRAVVVDEAHFVIDW